MSEQAMTDRSIYGGSQVHHTPLIEEPNINRVQACEGSSITKLIEPLTKHNWVAWCEQMRRVLHLCGVEEYAKGRISCPNDIKNTANWEFNDNYAQAVILNTITSTEMVHVGQCRTAQAVWENLEAIHELKGHQTIVSIIQNLFHKKAKEGSNINEHLGKLMEYWERINQINEEDFKISDTLFKIIISSSLPLSWDSFTESYVGSRKSMIQTDPKKMMGSQQFIGILKEEYIQRQLQMQNEETINQMSIPKQSLQNRLTSKLGSKSDTGMHCKQCG